jgi:hypothetical protein
MFSRVLLKHFLRDRKDALANQLGGGSKTGTLVEAACFIVIVHRMDSHDKHRI